MQSPSRRQYLALVGTTTAATLAGCLTEQEDPEFLVTNTNVRIEDGTNLVVRVTLENGKADTQESDMEVVVSHEGRDEQWRQEDTITLAGATEIHRNYTFEDIHEAGVDVEKYEVEAQLIEE